VRDALNLFGGASAASPSTDPVVPDAELAPTDVFFDLASQGCCVVDAGGRIVRANAEFGTLLGRRPAELAGLGFAGLFHADDAEALEAALTGANSAGAAAGVSVRGRGSDGLKRVVVSFTAAGDQRLAVAEPKGGAARSGRDDNEESARLIAERLGDGACSVQSDGRIVWASERYAGLVGSPVPDLVGETFPGVQAHAGHRSGVLDLIRGNREYAQIDVKLDSGVSVPMAVAAVRSGRGGALLVARDLRREQQAQTEARDAARRLQSLVTASTDAVWVGDEHAQTQFASSGFAQLVWSESDKLVGRGLADLFASADRERVQRSLRAARQSRRPTPFEARIGGAGYEEPPVRLTVHPVEGNAGRLAGLIATVTQEVSGSRTPRELRLRAELVNLIDAAVIASDRKGRITVWNSGARRLYGYTEMEALGRTDVELLAPHASPSALAAEQRELNRTSHWQEERIIRRKGGSEIPVVVKRVLLRDHDPSLSTVTIAVDITDRKETETQLQDARHYLGAIAGSLNEGLLAVAPDGCVAFANEAAEKLLGWKGEQLRGKSLHDATHYQRADGTPFPEHKCPIRIAARSGRAIQQVEDFFTRRDGTLIPVEYTATPILTKDGPRGIVVVFKDTSLAAAGSPVADASPKDSRWAGEIRDALDQQRFLLYAQPIADLATGSVVHHQLLPHMLVDGAIVGPSEFLAAAEDHGLIREIDHWVLQKGVALASPENPVEVRLSSQSIADPELVEAVRGALAVSGTDPSSLIVQMTAQALIDDADAAQRFARDMRDMGCRVAFDHFGTGYGGIVHVTELGVEYLKIGVEFVRDMVASPAGRHVVEALVHLARRFGCKTIAQGVEGAETLGVLSELGVDCAQGTAVGAPEPARAALQGG
jgi:PAS domain S-box-containing protein